MSSTQKHKERSRRSHNNTAGKDAFLRAANIRQDKINRAKALRGGQS